MLIDTVASGTSSFRDLEFVCGDGGSVWYHQSLLYQQSPLLRNILKPLASFWHGTGVRGGHQMVILDSVKASTVRAMLTRLIRGEGELRGEDLPEVQELVDMMGIGSEKIRGSGGVSKYNSSSVVSNKNPSLEEVTSELSSVLTAKVLDSDERTLFQSTSATCNSKAKDNPRPRDNKEKRNKQSKESPKDLGAVKKSKPESKSKKNAKIVTKEASSEHEEPLPPPKFKFNLKAGPKPKLRNTASAMVMGDIKLSFNLMEGEVQDNGEDFKSEIHLGDLAKNNPKKKRKRKMSPMWEVAVKNTPKVDQEGDGFQALEKAEAETSNKLKQRYKKDTLTKGDIRKIEKYDTTTKNECVLRGTLKDEVKHQSEEVHNSYNSFDNGKKERNKSKFNTYPNTKPPLVTQSKEPKKKLKVERLEKEDFDNEDEAELVVDLRKSVLKKEDIAKEPVIQDKVVYAQEVFSSDEDSEAPLVMDLDA
jgi:hypothetical protein